MGAYTNPNFRCSTCGHFVADHHWKADDEQDRGNCHATGAGCSCKEFLDSGSEDLATGDAAQIELKKLRAEKAAADAAELAKLRADKAARDAAAVN